MPGFHASPSRTPPASVAWLGYGGLLPFVGLAVMGLLDSAHPARWHQALVAYAAVILSFVGALHWAFAMLLAGLTPAQARLRYAWSVVPALLACPAVLLPLPFAAPLLILGFIAHYLQDRALVARGGLPAWYLPLRLRLSTVAVLALATSVLAGSV